MKSNVRFGLGIIAALSLTAICTLSASAAMTFDLDHCISGGRPIADQTSAPWLTASASSQNNNVLINLRAPNLSGNESVHEWLFNVDPHLTLAQLNSLRILAITTVAGSISVQSVTMIHENLNGISRAGFVFDSDIDSSIHNPVQALSRPITPDQHFTRGDQVQILIGTTLAGWTLSDTMFNPGHTTGIYDSTADIFNTTIGGNSGWIGATPPPVVVPEPSTFIAGLSTLLVLLFGGARFQKR